MVRTEGNPSHDIFGFCGYLQVAIRLVRIVLLGLLAGYLSA
jgi:hypothetical protein